MSVRAFDPLRALTPGVTLLEASAGTGKTYQITTLFLRLVAEVGLPVESVLVVTFTNAATAELRDRIRTRLGEAVRLLDAALSGEAPVDADPVLLAVTGLGGPGGVLGREVLEPRLSRLRAALRDFDVAPISTIHGFCARVLDENAFEGGVEHDLELLEDAGPVIAELVVDHLSATLRDADEPTVRFLRESAGLTVARLTALAEAVERHPDASFAPAVGEPDAWRARWQSWRELVARVAERWRRESAGLLALIDAATGKDEGRRATGPRLAGRRYQARYTLANAERLGAWLASSGLPSPDLGPQAPDRPRWFTYFAASSLAADTVRGEVAHPLADAVQQLVDLAGRFDFLDGPGSEFVLWARVELPRRLRARHARTYDDLLRDVRERVVDPEKGRALRDALRRRYRAALLDEFQDTDDVQWEVFRAVFADDPGAHLVLIGDPKQAIYAFRGADVHTYARAVEATPPDRRASLATNQRSDAALVAAVNTIFADRPRVFDVPFIAFDAVAASPRGSGERFRPQPAEPPLTIRWIDGPALGLPDAPPRLPKGVAAPRVTACLAAEIAALLRHEPPTTLLGRDGAWRRLTPRDVAVLVRTNRQALLVKDALLDQGLRAIVARSGSVFEGPMALAVQRLLEAVAEPEREGPSRVLAASDLLAWDAAALLAVDDDGVDDHPAWEELRADVRRWARLVERSGIAATIRRASADRGVLQRLAGLPDGERRVTDLRHLTELLHLKETRERLGVEGLVRWLREQRAGSGADAEAVELRLESDADAVQVLTVHASKGLEFPVVFLPFAWDAGAERSDVVVRWHDAARRLALDAHLDAATPSRVEATAAAEREARQEELRLLYVALTRARHRAVVYWGPVSGAEKAALAAVLHGGASGEDVADRRARAQARFEAGAAEEPPFTSLQAELGVLSAASCVEGRPTVGWSRAAIPTGRVAGALGEADEPELVARDFTRGPFDRRWRRWSYTSLAREVAAEEAPRLLAGLPDELEARDDDPGGAAPLPPPTVVPAAAGPLADLRGGTDVGRFVHRALELLDFPTLREKAPTRRPAAELLDEIARSAGLADSPWPARLAEALPGLLSTPLGPRAGDACLADLAAAARLDELGFDLPLAGGGSWRPDLPVIDGADVARCLALRGDDPRVRADYLRQLADVPWSPLCGFLTGSIDLATRLPTPVGPRWFVLDYKTNRLAGYGPLELCAEMERHHYVLQYHLYLVALHRYLALRVPGYDYDRDVGGAAYLFLRGLRGPDTPRAPDGEVEGVFLDRPPRAVIEGLSALFHGPGGPA